MYLGMEDVLWEIPWTFQTHVVSVPLPPREYNWGYIGQVRRSHEKPSQSTLRFFLDGTPGSCNYENLFTMGIHTYATYLICQSFGRRSGQQSEAAATANSYPRTMTDSRKE